MLDTGMQAEYVKNGRASALEIKGDVFTAIYVDRRDVLTSRRRGPIAVNLMRRARLPVRGAVAALVLAWLLAAGPAAEPVEQAKSTTPPVAQPAEAPPWPNAAELAERRREAERRRLFRSAEPVAITIAADFRAVQRDRDVTSTKMFPATITFPAADGQTASMPLLIRTRGHSRRKPTLCDFAPLRLEFQKELTKNTLFDGPRSLKLGAHCRDNGTFEQYVLREHAVYRLFNLLTPRSFRSRLAKMTYVDAKNGRTVATRFGHFIEDDDDVARRLEGRIKEAKGTLVPADPFRNADADDALRVHDRQHRPVGQPAAQRPAGRNAGQRDLPHPVRLRFFGAGQHHLLRRRQAPPDPVRARPALPRALPDARRTGNVLRQDSAPSRPKFTRSTTRSPTWRRATVARRGPTSTSSIASSIARGI